MLRVGEKAPNFTLRATGGRSISLSDYRGKRNVVLFFYHQDDHPVCTQIAAAFRDVQPDIEGAEAAIVGVSSDNVLMHETFARKNKLRYFLLADEGKVVWNAYAELRGEKAGSGDDRMVCVVDKEGMVRRVWSEMTGSEPTAEVVSFLCELQKMQI